MFKNKSLKNLFIFDFLFQLMYIIIFIPFFKMFFNLYLTVMDINFLSPDIIKKIFPSPLKLITILFIIFCMAFLSLIEHTSFIFTLSKIKEKHDLSILEIGNNTYKLIKRKLTFGNSVILLFSLFGLPFSSFVTKKIKIPSYVINHLFENNLFIVYLILILLVIYLFAIFFIFTYHCFYLENNNIFNSFIESYKIAKNNLKDTNYTILNILFKRFLLFASKITILSILLFILYINEKDNLENYKIIIYFMIAGFIKASLNVLINYVIFRNINELYYKIREKEKIESLEFIENNKIQLKLTAIFIAIILISSINKYNYSIKEIQAFHNFTSTSPYIIAHRGSTKKSAENTLESVREAIEEKADFIEIDVSLTKDNVVVLSHDNNLKRLTGLKAKLNKLTYKQLKDYKIKNTSFKRKFNFVDLKSVIKECRGKIKLNIELKPTKNNHKQFAKEIVNLVKNDYENIVISSLSTEVLKEIKLLDKNIKCGLILAFSYGNFYSLDYIDFYCIDENFADTLLIKKIKKFNKAVYIWNANTEDAISNALKKGADGIITDEIKKAKEIIKNEVYSIYDFITMKILKIIK